MAFLHQINQPGTLNQLLQNSLSLPPFQPNRNRQNTLLTFPENSGGGGMLAALAAEVNTNLRLHVLCSRGKNPYLERCGWVLRRASVFVLKHFVRRHLTWSFYFRVSWLERRDLPPPLTPPCQLSFLTFIFN